MGFYFREVPNLDYISPFRDRPSSETYITGKNLFRRVKIRDDLKGIFTLYNEYSIEGDDRPDVVAEKVYNDSSLDWVILVTNNIINIRNEWPLSDRDLRNFCQDKYGNQLLDTRYYVTTEVTDSKGRLILPAGLTVDSDFTIPDPDEATQNINPVTGVSNLEYETNKNDEKRQIFILRREYLAQFLEDTKQEMFYKKSSQYVSNTVKRGDNIRTSSP
jgi:hypothetical protein